MVGEAVYHCRLQLAPSRGHPHNPKSPRLSSMAATSFYGLGIFDFCGRGSLLHEFFTAKLVCGIVSRLLGVNHACVCLPANLDCISVLHEI